MGYTTGRRLSQKVLADIALNYKSKSEFQRSDPSAYTTARIKGVLDKICGHMSTKSFSIPQLICKMILNRLFKEKCLYNSRKIIAPYEIDIYYPHIKFAVEYNGKKWHNDEAAIARDKYKANQCKQKSITLVVITERSRNYESDIKSQLIENIGMLQLYLPHLTEDAIEKIKVDWDVIYKECSLTISKDDLILATRQTKTVKEFRQKYPNYYRYIRKTKQFHLLSQIRKVSQYSDAELKRACLTFRDYGVFVKSKYYSICHRRGLLKLFTNHMTKRYKTVGLENLESTLGRFKSRKELKKACYGAYKKAKKMGLLLKYYGPPRQSKWSKESILSLARTCRSATEFKLSYSHARRMANKLGMNLKWKEGALV